MSIGVKKGKLEVYKVESWKVENYFLSFRNGAERNGEIPSTLSMARTSVNCIQGISSLRYEMTKIWNYKNERKENGREIKDIKQKKETVIK